MNLDNMRDMNSNEFTRAAIAAMAAIKAEAVSRDMDFADMVHDAETVAYEKGFGYGLLPIDHIEITTPEMAREWIISVAYNRAILLHWEDSPSDYETPQGYPVWDAAESEVISKRVNEAIDIIGEDSYFRVAYSAFETGTRNI